MATEQEKELKYKTAVDSVKRMAESLTEESDPPYICVVIPEVGNMPFIITNAPGPKAVVEALRGLAKAIEDGRFLVPIPKGAEWPKNES